MIAIKEIKKGDALTTSCLADLVDQTDDDERKERLRWIGFNCKCDRGTYDNN